MIFMSDGGDGGNAAANTSARQLRACADASHYVAFGSGAAQGRLQELARESNGKFHAALQGDDLIRVFADIAANADQMTANMVQKFGQKMADMVVNKFVSDHM